ncbi:MAG: hypothetical protein IAE84_18655 [Saprospiraceae bacterium]|nr:hypothetical protein [Saprospiraceae bacterium]
MKRAHTLLIFAALAALLHSCAPPVKLLIDGQYEKAYRNTISQLRNGLPANESRRLVLEASYLQLFEAETAKEQALLNHDDEDRWIDLAEHYRQMKKRRAEAQRWLPTDIGYSMERLDLLHADAARRAHDFCVAEAENRADEARSGDKSAARQAFNLLQIGGGYAALSSELQGFRQEMQRAGTYTLWVNYGADDATQRWTQRLHRGFYAPKTYNWLEILHEQPQDRPADFRLDAVLERAYASPESQSVSRRTVCKEIQDGEDIVRETVKVNDSTTVQVEKRIPRMITVTATIYQTTQTKEADVLMRYRLYRQADNALLDEWVLNSSDSFCNTYESFSGDSRALDACCSGMSHITPSDHDMIQNAVAGLRRQLDRYLTREFLWP